MCKPRSLSLQGQPGFFWRTEAIWSKSYSNHCSVPSLTFLQLAEHLSFSMCKPDLEVQMKRTDILYIKSQAFYCRCWTFLVVVITSHMYYPVLWAADGPLCLWLIYCVTDTPCESILLHCSVRIRPKLSVAEHPEGCTAVGGAFIFNTA